MTSLGSRVKTEEFLQMSSYAWCSDIKGKLGHTHRENACVSMKAKMGVMCLQPRNVKDCPQSLEARREDGRGSPRKPQKEHIDLRLLVSRLWDNKFLPFKPPVCGTSYGRHLETDIPSRHSILAQMSPTQGRPPHLPQNELVPTSLTYMVSLYSSFVAFILFICVINYTGTDLL